MSRQAERNQGIWAEITFTRNVGKELAPQGNDGKGHAPRQSSRKPSQRGIEQGFMG